VRPPTFPASSEPRRGGDGSKRGGAIAGSPHGRPQESPLPTRSELRVEKTEADTGVGFSPWIQAQRRTLTMERGSAAAQWFRGEILRFLDPDRTRGNHYHASQSHETSPDHPAVTERSPLGRSTLAMGMLLCPQRWWRRQARDSCRRGGGSQRRRLIIPVVRRNGPDRSGRDEPRWSRRAAAQESRTAGGGWVRLDGPRRGAISSALSHSVLSSSCYHCMAAVVRWAVSTDSKNRTRIELPVQRRGVRSLLGWRRRH
jgi:hypothetical protein